MTKKRQQHGFSLTETLMAVGTLAIGMTFIGGTFLTGIYFATLSTERTVAAVASEEAFAKMQIFGLDVDDPNLKTSEFVPYEDLTTLPAKETFYPSTSGDSDRQYSWSALCRRVVDVNDGPDGAATKRGELIQCVVFISRETGAHSSYRKRQSGSIWPQLAQTDLPCPVRVNIAQNSGMTDQVLVKDAVSGDAVDERTFVAQGSILVDNATGGIYRVLERDKTQPEKVTLDRAWDGGDLTASDGGWVWVVPPPVAGGRIPCIAVYQKIIRFPRP
ncbi:MAG: type II secretion system protein [Planctomycetes bacterium]|nr:type II secretion system protein [Planctomycetota bacterium]